MPLLPRVAAILSTRRQTNRVGQVFRKPLLAEAANRGHSAESGAVQTDRLKFPAVRLRYVLHLATPERQQSISIRHAGAKPSSSLSRPILSEAKTTVPPARATLAALIISA